MKLAKYIFNFAGILGLLMLIPQYFLEGRINRDQPPAITHPEYFYGFIGVAIAFQIVFLIIARNPEKYRSLMLAAMIEKFSFAIACIVLLLQNRIPMEMFGAGMIDLTLGVLFIIAFIKTPNSHKLI